MLVQNNDNTANIVRSEACSPVVIRTFSLTWVSSAPSLDKGAACVTRPPERHSKASSLIYTGVGVSEAAFSEVLRYVYCMYE